MSRARCGWTLSLGIVRSTMAIGGATHRPALLAQARMLGVKILMGALGEFVHIRIAC